jgi:hypothetical protein
VELVTTLFQAYRPLDGAVMSGFTLSDRHTRALRAVVDASKLVYPQMAVPSRVLENLRELIGCDHVMIEGCDYGNWRFLFLAETLGRRKLLHLGCPQGPEEDVLVHCAVGEQSLAVHPSGKRRRGYQTYGLPIRA